MYIKSMEVTNMDFMVMLQKGSEFTRVAVKDAADKVEAVVRTQQLAKRTAALNNTSIVMYRELRDDFCQYEA